MIEGSYSCTDSLPRPQRLPRYSRIVMFGDFLSPIAEIAEVVDSFTSRGLIGHLVQILDPAEESLPYDGRVLFEGPEYEGGIMISQVEALRKGYIEELAEHRKNICALCRRFGWSVISHRTDQPPEQTLLALYEQLSDIRKV